MTEEQLRVLYETKSSIKEREAKARAILSQCSSDSLANNLSCDHVYPDGLIAVGGNYICSICGCGADLKRVEFLQSLSSTP